MSLRVLYSSPIQNDSLSAEKHSVLEVRRSGTVPPTIQTRFVFECDEISSVLVKAVRSSLSSVVTSSKGIHDDRLSCSGLDFVLQSIIVKDDLLSHIEKIMELLRRILGLLEKTKH